MCAVQTQAAAVAYKVEVLQGVVSRMCEEQVHSFTGSSHVGSAVQQHSHTLSSLQSSVHDMARQQRQLQQQVCGRARTWTFGGDGNSRYLL
jgi:hypothetical protein